MNDVRVKLEQSEWMVAALRKAGHPTITVHAEAGPHLIDRLARPRGLEPSAHAARGGRRALVAVEAAGHDAGDGGFADARNRLRSFDL